MKYVLALSFSFSFAMAACSSAQTDRQESFSPESAAALSALRDSSSTPQAPREKASLPRELTLNQALWIASQHPQTRALQLRVQAALLDGEQAGIWPSLELDSAIKGIPADFNNYEALEAEIWLRQPLELGGKAGARRELANALADREDAALVSGLVARRQSVIDAFFGVVFVQEQIALLTELNSAVAALHDAAKLKWQAGRISEREYLPFKLEFQEAQLELQNAGSELKPALAALGSAIGLRPEAFPVEKCSGTFDAPSPLVIESVKEDIGKGRSPALFAAQREINVARAARQNEQALGWPDLKLGVGFAHEFEHSRNLLGVSFSVPLPLWNTRRDAVAAAEVREQAARQQFDAARLEVAREFEERKSHLEVADETVRCFEQEILPTAQRSYEVAKAAFEAERLSFVESLEPLNALLRTRLKCLEWARRRSSAQASLEALAFSARR